MSLSFRKSIVEYLIQTTNSPHILTADKFKEKNIYLINKFNCNCTDCNGSDSLGPCKVEELYYKKTR
jgi:hypothetical protein